MLSSLYLLTFSVTSDKRLILVFQFPTFFSSRILHNVPTCAIINHDLYIFYALFEDNFFVFKVFFEKILYYSEAICNQDWVIMACVGYMKGKRGRNDLK